MFAELFCSSSMMGVLGAGGLLACGACFPAPPKGLNPGAVISTDWDFFFNHDRLDTDIAAICDGVFSRVRIGNQDIRLAGPRPASAPPLEQAEPLNDSRLGRTKRKKKVFRVILVELEREIKEGGQNTKIWPKGEGMGLWVERGSGKISLYTRVG